MINLIYKGPNGMTVKNDILAEKVHFLIGRHEDNDDVIASPEKISRFHCMIFELEARYYLSAFSLNPWTHYNRHAPKFSKDTCIASVNVPKSHKGEKISKWDNVSNIVDYEPHKFQQLEDMQELLVGLHDAENAVFLASQSTLLHNGSHIGIGPQGEHRRYMVEIYWK